VAGAGAGTSAGAGAGAGAILSNKSAKGCIYRVHWLELLFGGSLASD